MSHRRKGELLDDADQTPEAGPDNPQYLESDLRVRKAKRVEILFAYKQQGGFVDRGDGCRIIAAVEHREFCDRTAGSLYAKDMLPPGRWAFKDSHMTQLNYIKSRARLALSKDCFAGNEAAWHGALCQ